MEVSNRFRKDDSWLEVISKGIDKNWEVTERIRSIKNISKAFETILISNWNWNTYLYLID